MGQESSVVTVDGDSSIRGFIETDADTRMDPVHGIRRLGALAVIFDDLADFTKTYLDGAARAECFRSNAST